MPTSAKALLKKLDTFPWKKWSKDLAAGLEQEYRDLVKVRGEEVAEAYGAVFDLADPFVSAFITDYVGERIVQLDRTTKRDVSRLIVRTFDAGEEMDVATLQDRVLDEVRRKFDDYEAWRALRIARTESGIGFNHATVLGSKAAGFDDMEVTDGTQDEECAAANGAIWSIEECLANPLGHPNCTRVFAPHVPDVEEVYDEDDDEDDDE